MNVQRRLQEKEIAIVHMEIYWYAIYHVLSYFLHNRHFCNSPSCYAPIYSFLNSSDCYLDRDSLYIKYFLQLV